MNLNRFERKWLDLEVTAVDVDGNPVTVEGVKLTIDGGATWLDPNTAAGGFRYMVEHPDFDGSLPGTPTVPPGVTPIVIPASTSYYVRAVASPEVEVASGKIWLLS